MSKEKGRRVKILITGATGLLGSELAQHWQRHDTTVAAPSSVELDVSSADSVRRAVRAFSPDVIINCAVIISIDRCEAEPDLAWAVNRDGVMNLLEAAREFPAPPLFIQVSSSEVFGRWNGGFAINGYREYDEPKPDTVYQKSKTEAERMVAEFAAKHPESLSRWYVIRASWLYGEGRPTFVEQFAEALRARQELTIAEDQWRNPTWTRDFAASLDALIANREPSGIYHIANEVAPGEATVMDVIEEIRSYYAIPKEAIRLKPVHLHAFFKIPRAPSNVLLNTKLPRMRPWREALKEYLSLR
ncbi:MAG: hypothetical protein A3A44_00575 [Candidatus Sungbacteria bacterium RIFCSPLOWO2_01_FULL_60_25]|uniref:dTDP-4-dehydrorhamnose reductase n=1 Tax=Candidatus Sungbacteria bacterium RIFCSPLOWO2_01_FULL_60_25 TaxID=1802281 RepID=A0A1G2LE15_9BACT|nr:MAG: hypothetical protein A3A44_00575 [Candidatus Sungbacteria bacterium RIFCSPLOWO2_01_FULL_60_25]